MNTLLFGDMLEAQYFLEDLVHKGYRKDNSKSHSNATCYVLKDSQVVLNLQALTADVYVNGKLIERKSESESNASA